MKRKICLLFVVLSLLLTLAISASANVACTLVIDEDLQHVTVNGDVYVRADVSQLEGYYYRMDADVQLTEAQQELYKDVQLYVMEDVPSVIRLDIQHKDGMTMQITYIEESAYEEYLSLLEQEEYTVRFVFPSDNDIITEKSLLCDEETTLYKDQLNRAIFFDVYAVGENWMTIRKGWLVIVDEAYYYVDMEATGLDGDDYLYRKAKVDAWRVTDRDLRMRFDNAMDAYYGDGLGVLENPEVADRVSSVFMVIIFGFLPFAVLVAFTLFAIFTKKRAYRIQYIVVSSCAALVLVTVLVLVLIV